MRDNWHGRANKLAAVVYDVDTKLSKRMKAFGLCAVMMKRIHMVELLIKKHSTPPVPRFASGGVVTVRYEMPEQWPWLDLGEKIRIFHKQSLENGMPLRRHNEGFRRM